MHAAMILEQHLAFHGSPWRALLEALLVQSYYLLPLYITLHTLYSCLGLNSKRKLEEANRACMTHG